MKLHKIDTAERCGILILRATSEPDILSFNFERQMRHIVLAQWQVE